MNDIKKKDVLARPPILISVKLDIARCHIKLMTTICM